jgi:hypothetical protein
VVSKSSLLFDLSYFSVYIENGYTCRCARKRLDDQERHGYLNSERKKPDVHACTHTHKNTDWSICGTRLKCGGTRAGISYWTIICRMQQSIWFAFYYIPLTWILISFSCTITTSPLIRRSSGCMQNYYRAASNRLYIYRCMIWLWGITQLRYAFSTIARDNWPH